MLGSEAQRLLSTCPLAALVLDSVDRIVFANPRALATLAMPVIPTGRLVTEAVANWPSAGLDGSDLVIDGRDHRRAYRLRVGTHSCENEFLRIVWLEPTIEADVAEQAAREADGRLRYMIEMLPQAVCFFDAEERYVLWNQRYADLYADIAAHLRPGITFEEILKLSLASGDMREAVAEPDAWLEERMTKFRRQVSQEEQRLRDGRWLRHDDRRTPDGGAIGIRIDITDLKQREEWLRQLFDANPMPMLLCDGFDLTILEANQAAIRFYGTAERGLLTRRASDMHVDGQGQVFIERVLRLEGHCDASTVWRQRLDDGRERHVLIYVRTLRRGLERRFLLAIVDVTDRVAAEIEATRLANHDALTGLANRMQFYRHLDEALQANAGGVVIYCLDLDGFKPVNDVFGHATGDEVLQLVALRLREQAGEHMTARLGGDEFAILVRNAGAADTHLAERCIAACREPFTIRDMQIRIGVSIGMAVAVGTDRADLLKAADEALYRSKAAGRNRWCVAGGKVRRCA